MYKTERNGDAFKCYGTDMFHNHAVPVQETKGRLEEFPYGYGASFDKDGQLRRLFYYGYPTEKLEHIQNYPEIVLKSNLKWNIDFDENGKVTGQVGKISDSDLQDVCYGTGEFNRILEENGKAENLRQTIFKLLNDIQDEEEKRIKAVEGDFELTFLQKYLDTYFAKEMLPSQSKNRVQEKQIQGAKKTETESPKKKPTLKSTLLRRTSSDKKKAEAIKAVKEILGR